MHKFGVYLLGGSHHQQLSITILGLKTYLEELTTCKHALLQTSVKEIHMVSHKLVNGADNTLRTTFFVFFPIEFLHESLPIWFNNL